MTAPRASQLKAAKDGIVAHVSRQKDWNERACIFDADEKMTANNAHT